jgi:hypothetical protein
LRVASRPLTRRGLNAMNTQDRAETIAVFRTERES